MRECRSGSVPAKEACGVNVQDRERRERLELERAGWERLAHEGEAVWRNPVSGYVYPQGIAISMLREGADPDVPLGPEGGA
jgi:hypothetical protein